MKIKTRLFLTTAIMTFAVATIGEARAAYPSGYYDSLEGKCGAELMQAVKKVVRNHTVINYGENGTWNAFKDTDVRTINGVKYWWDMYSNNNVAVSSGHPGLNIEHSVANSWWGGDKNDAYKDIVHLNPSNSDANSRKSNYPLAELSSVTWDNGVTFVGKPKSGLGGGASNCYEPCDEYKGDFARAFMYMFTVYDDISWRTSNGYGYMYNPAYDTMFKPWAAQMLVKWSTNDPVSEKELTRNEGIYKHQKNRNPFIDLPSLADHIWGSKSTVPFSLNGNAGDDGDDNGDDDDNNGNGNGLTSDQYLWLSSKDTDMGDWTIENVTLPKQDGYVWRWSSNNGNYYLSGSAFISNVAYAAKSYAWSPVVSFAGVKTATISFEHSAKFQTTLKTLCKVAVKDVDSGEITEVSIPSWPTAGNWNFVSSGNIDLSSYSGKNVRVGLKYESNTSGADTWEINNFKLNLTRNTTDISNATGYDEDDSFLVEVWGNNILAPEGARIFDLNGREFNGENLQKGVYIVVKPTFDKSVKVMVR